MSTPKENSGIAAAGSNEQGPREEAISWLEAANECDMLGELVRVDDLEDQLRARGWPACTPSVQTDARDAFRHRDLPESIRKRAGTLVQDRPDDSGASL